MTIDTTTRSPPPIEFEASRPGALARALGWLVYRIDDRLRASQRVYEFSQRAGNIFRMQVRVFDQDVVLDDATRAFVGDAIIDLHIWNEHLPMMQGGSLRWARRMSECLHTSLCDLADYLATARHLDGIAVIRANMGFATATQTQQLVRIASLYGFEAIEDPRPRAFRQRVHRLGENILISLMVLSRNGVALRRSSLSRSRVQVFVSRRKLTDRYAGAQPRVLRTAEVA